MNAKEEFIQAYENHSDAIFRHCYFRVFDREVARDLTQETFLRTWDYLQKEGKAVENLKAFLYRVATNLIIDRSRKKRETSLEVLQELGFEVVEESRAVDFVEIQSLMAAVEMLFPDDREVVTLSFVEDLAPVEIADILGISANAVSVRLHRAIKKLRLIMQEKIHARRN